MSQRGKRPNRSEDGSVPVKRRKRTTAEEEEATSLVAAISAATATPPTLSTNTVTTTTTTAAATITTTPPTSSTTGVWQPRSNDLKSIYNRTTTEAPAELFRKDLISAMKLPDSEPLASNEYWVIVDQWKQEWERGVQVPVNPDSLPEPSVTITHCSSLKPQHEFKLPKNKYIRITKDENFKMDEHVLSNAPAQAEAACSYDLDECDVAWLKILNAERAMSGLCSISEDKLERVIEQFELTCWDKIQTILRNEEGLGIEYDETVICDVCRSPDSEEGNEMVFCDSCNICVHQACYGITKIPDGQWLCCTCNLGKRPECVLCPNKGGAMKCTRSGQKWAHVSCALWIPEVSIGCVEKMEPITKISSIPASRWALICVLCRERVGACIQCSVKTCKTAYHVTCAFKHGLEMRAIIEDENADDGVKLRSYCEKHSKSSKKEKSVCSGSEDDDSKRKKRKDMTSEEKNQARAARLQEIEAEFYKHVSIKDINIHLDIDNDALHYIYNYWKLKRKAGHNKPLLPPKSEDVDMLSHKREQADLEKMKMFVQLRQDLERVRNLCYMVSRREKLSRSFFRMREQTFHKQAAVLESSTNLPNVVVQAVIEANHGPSIYDRLYSHRLAEDHTTDFDLILSRIVGIKSPSDSSDEHKLELNGLLKDVKNNPYKKVYVNGSSQRRSRSLYGSSLSSASSSDEKPKDNKENRLQSHSNTDDEKPTLIIKKKQTSPRKTNNNNNNNSSNNSKTNERRKKRHSASSRCGASGSAKIDSSSEDDNTTKSQQTKKDWKQFSRSRLRQVERELGISGSDSDELMPPTNIIRKTDSRAMSFIYSDSDSSDVSMKNDDKSSNAASDSQQSRLRTKAAVKEFSNKPTTSSKSPNKNSVENKRKNKIDNNNKQENLNKKKDYVPSDLIVPQRQAAKKATENLKSTTLNRTIKEQLVDEQQKIDEKPRSQKTKTKSGKDREIINKEQNKKDTNKSDIFDVDKDIDKVDNQEILAYVPQRQAAKKAAEHIKSGLSKPISLSSTTDHLVIDQDKYKKEPTDILKTKKDFDNKHRHEMVDKPAKLIESKRKSSSNSSSSSSTSSSSDTSSSSSSDSDDGQQSQKPTQTTRSESLFSNQNREQARRTNTKDWPFLDKGTKPEVSSSASSDSSDSSEESRSPRKHTSSSSSSTSSASSTKSKADFQSTQTAAAATTTTTATAATTATKIFSDKTIRKSTEKKQWSSQREEPIQCNRGKGRSSRGRTKTSKSSDRIGDVNVRTRDLSNNECSDIERERTNEYRKGGKSDEIIDKSEKEIYKSSKLQSPINKTEKKLIKDRTETESITTNLEREILERKAGKQGLSKTKSTLDRLFGPPEKKLEKIEKTKMVNNKITKPMKSEKQIKSTVKENKEPVVDNVTSPIRKSPTKNKNIDDIFVEKSSTKENIIENKEKLSKRDDELSVLRSENYNVDNCDIQKPVDVYTTSSNTNTNCAQIDIVNEKKISGKCHEYQPNRSIFSPPHPKDMLDFDNFDDGFGISKDEEIVKGPLTFHFANNTTLFKEDSKEDSARETLNLVEKLRMELSKKSTSCDIDDGASVSSSTKNENERNEFSEQVVPNSVHEELNNKPEPKLEEEGSVSTVNLEMRVEVTDTTIPSSKSNETERNQDYRYMSCEADVPVETNKDIPIQHHGISDHSTTAQGDERWVPPSENYLNIQPSIDTINYVNERSNVPTPQHYLQQYSNQQHHKNQPILNTIPPQIELRLHEDTVKSQSPNVHERRISQTPLIDPSSMDCMPSPSPYADIHPQAKWADSEVMPNRRSSSSSTTSSTSSSCSRRNDEDEAIKMRPDMMVINHPNLENIGFLPPQGLPFPPNSLDSFPGFTDTSQFVGPVSLFPPPSLNAQLPFPSAGPAMFPPAFGAPFPTPHSVIPPLPKPVDDTIQYSSTCTATFTSSQHNMALTAAMVNIPHGIAKELETTREEDLSSIPPVPIVPEPTTTPTPPPPTTTTAPLPPPPPPPPTSSSSSSSSEPALSNEEIVPSPVVSNTTPNSSNVLASPSPSIKSNSSTGKKSPSKPTRTSARVTSQLQKSPSKSPGRSPRQEILKQTNINRIKNDTKRNVVNKTNTNRNNQGQIRGRGRGRGRAKSVHQNNDYDFIGTNTIQNKLVGTVYDFNIDDPISNDNLTDLKSMRERRKSVDIHERKLDCYSSKDSSQSPKFSSPSQASHKSSRSINADLKELRPPTPVENNEIKPEPPKIENDRNQIFPDIVQPVLPGPVDMRTYNNNFDQQNYNETNLLRAFDAGTTESQVHDEIDDEFEKELHSALTSTDKKLEEPSTPEVGNIKVSLSDSRNQLKVKIKGPIANYSASVAALPAPTVDPNVVSNINSVANNVISNNSIGMSSGTSNLRRMRKKELLRQYWTQDMNMVDSNNCNPGFNATPTAPPVNRTIITIPKAVASMTSIPTKEDYRDYRTGSDDIVETTKQHRKETKSRPGALSRELRQLNLSLDEDSLSDRQRNISSLSSNNCSLSTNFDSSITNKRRGRPPRPSQQSSNTTPKIKIKIGNNIVGESTKIDDKKDRIRPPKKRLTRINLPSVEDLKRESMKFRKLVMADFGEEKKKKKDKSEKRKKKKAEPQVQIISNETQNPTKLIIRFGKKLESGSVDNRTSCSDIGDNNNKCLNEQKNQISDIVNEQKQQIKNETINSGGIVGCDDGANMIPKITPIKLKLSRCQEGSGYVMKSSSQHSEPKQQLSEERQKQQVNDEVVMKDIVEPGQPPPVKQSSTSSSSSASAASSRAMTNQQEEAPQYPSHPTTTPSPISLPDGVHPPPPLPLNKDCEVR